MRHIRTKTRITDPVEIQVIISRLVRIETLGKVISLLCQSESTQPDPCDLSELGKMISEEAGIIISHVEDEQKIVRPDFE